MHCNIELVALFSLCRYHNRKDGGKSTIITSSGWFPSPTRKKLLFYVFPFILSCFLGFSVLFFFVFSVLFFLGFRYYFFPLIYFNKIKVSKTFYFLDWKKRIDYIHKHEEKQLDYLKQPPKSRSNTNEQWLFFSLFIEHSHSYFSVTHICILLTREEEKNRL